MTGVELKRQPERELAIKGLPQTGMQDVRSPRDQKLAQVFFRFFDLALVWISAGAAHWLSLAHSRAIQNASRQEFFQVGSPSFSFLLSVLVVLFATMRGLYKFPWEKTYREDLKLLAESVASAGIVSGACSYLQGIKVVSPEAFVLTILLTWVSLAAWRKFVRLQSIPGLTEKRNVLIVGSGRIAHLLRAHLEQNPQLGYVVKGFLCRRRSPRSTDKGTNSTDNDLLGPVNQLPAIARAHFIDEILISVPSDRHLVKEIARHARNAGVQARVVPDLYDGLTMDQPIEYIGQIPTLTVCESPIPTGALVIKRLVDIAVSAIALLALLPLFAVVALIVKTDSKGPILFGSLRVGKKGRTFICYKFRTMVENADALIDSLRHLNERDGVLFKIAGDPRITRAGRYLRKFSIDELPQFWNVLKGDMSLVGPRPPVCGEYTQYALEHLRRLDVTPGVTGLWQVTARRDPSFRNYIELDKDYVNNWSLGLDCRILWRTIGVVLAGTGQ